MKKKTLIARLFAFSLCSMLAFGACSFPGQNSNEPVREEEENEDDEELGEIEVSDKKVEIEAGEEFEVEIENYDDLKKVTIEVEDEDIAEAELEDEIITITGISEGKTTITVSAKNCEDFEITVKVTEPEELVDPATGDFDGEFQTGEYLSTFVIPNSVWEQAMGTDAEYFIEFLSNKEFTFDFIMVVNDDGTALLTYDCDKFVMDFVDYLDENFIDFMKIVFENEGQAWSEEYEDAILEMKDGLMDEFRATIDESVADLEDQSVELTWELKDEMIIFTPEGDVEKECEILPDGSFVLSFTADELGHDMFGDKFDLCFSKR